jgi:hypothetical protein
VMRSLRLGDQNQQTIKRKEKDHELVLNCDETVRDIGGPDDNGNCTCLAINGYHVDPEIVFCDSTQEVEKVLNKTGIDHLKAIYQIEYTAKEASVREVKVKYRATIE